MVAKIRASETTLSDVNAILGVIRLPKNSINDSLADLTTAQKNAIKDKLISIGYPLSEIRQRFGNNIDLQNYTLADVLRFALKRRLKPRFGDATRTVVIDGPEQPTRSLEDIDQGA